MRQPPVGHPAVTIAAAAAATTNRARTLRLAADYSQGGPAANAFFFFRRELIAKRCAPKPNGDGLGGESRGGKHKRKPRARRTQRLSRECP